MTKTVLPGVRYGTVEVPASKSQAHRMLICAALGEKETTLICNSISRDIAATMDCLRALGADISSQDQTTFRIRPITAAAQETCILPCGESGSTLRFMIPLVGALGVGAVFQMQGRLPQRPLQPLTDVLCANGMHIEQNGDQLSVGGRLRACHVTLPGNVSSQYISGLLMAMPLLSGDSTLRIEGNLESEGYIGMTQQVMSLGGITVKRDASLFGVAGARRYRFAPPLQVEGDYSGAAFFLCAGAFSERGITVQGLNPDSTQGDRAVLELLRSFGAVVRQEGNAVTVSKGELIGQTVDAAPIPDLIPVLSVVAAAAKGRTHIVNAARLRLKESDRLQSTADMLRALGASVTELSDGLIIDGVGSLRGGTVDSYADHRIAMSAAVAAAICTESVTVTDAQCVQKSYLPFWEHLERLQN